MRYDPAALKKVQCPLCGSVGTLRPIGMGQRLRVGPWSYALLLFKAFTCEGCGGSFSNDEVMRTRQAA